MTLNDDVCDKCGLYTDPIGDDYAQALPTGKLLCGSCLAAAHKTPGSFSSVLNEISRLAAEDDRSLKMWRRRCLEAEALLESLTRSNYELDAECQRLEARLRRFEHIDDGNGCSCGRVHQDRT